MKEKIEGCILGSALGDGFGYPNEFMRIDEIIDQWGINGLTEPYGDPIKVTDDTQMSIAVFKALIDTFLEAKDITPVSFEKHLKQKFIEWYVDPENNRAPGMTCLMSCEKLLKGLRWEDATAKNSKGCGANMRVFPVSVFKFKDNRFKDIEVSKWAQFQSALTHAHPTALAASDLTAITLLKLLEGAKIECLIDDLIDYAHSQKRVYHYDYLADIWMRPGINQPEDFIELGWVDCISALKNVKKAFLKKDKISDPCIYTGEGWIAEEAFATGLLCFLYFPDKPVAALRRAVNTTGDSDSIACLTGGFVGAYNGISQFPSDWVERIEYKEALQSLIKYIID